MRRYGLLTLFAIVCLSGCTLIPQYSRPAAPVPAQWPAGEAYKKAAIGEGGPVLVGWREFYGDERLQKVLDLALTNNRDLRVTAANIERARALYRIQRAQLFPTVAGSGAYTTQRTPAGTSATGEAFTSDVYSLSTGVTSWELDFFGRIRSLNEAALQQYIATEQAQESALISLMAEVVNVYLTRAADAEGLALAKSTLTARERSHELIRRRFEIGVSTQLDLRQAETLLETARGDVARFTGQLALDENAINLLVGAPVPADLLSDQLSRIVPPKEIWAGISSEVLLARPDVLQSESLLKSANANIGAARAAFFPRIALTSSIGTISPDLDGLFKAGSATWLFSPQVSVPIFDWGTRRANLRVSQADRDAALARYEKTIQSAFREVADALARQGTLGDQLQAQRSLVAAAADSYRLSDARYTKGIDSFLNVLDSQRSLYTAQQGLISLHLARLSNVVTLYKVLGGKVESTGKAESRNGKQEKGRQEAHGIPGTGYGTALGISLVQPLSGRLRSKFPGQGFDSRDPTSRFFTFPLARAGFWLTIAGV
jgi:multidrug efflux system outer membrane protein